MGNAAARPGAELLDVGRGAGELGGCDHLHGLPLGGEAVSGARSSYEASGGLGDECSASRVGFWIEPGCRLTSSGFLPPALAPSGVGVDSCRMVLSDSQPGFVAEVGGRW